MAEATLCFGRVNCYDDAMATRIPAAYDTFHTLITVPSLSNQVNKTHPFV